MLQIYQVLSISAWYINCTTLSGHGRYTSEAKARHSYSKDLLVQVFSPLHILNPLALRVAGAA